MIKKASTLLVTLVLSTTLFLSMRFLYYEIRYPVKGEKTTNSIDVSKEPTQGDTNAKPLTVENRKGSQVELTPVATYDIEARVIINETYPNFWNVCCGLDDLLTNDLVLVWGRFAENKYLKKVRFSHQWTYMTFSYQDPSLNTDPGYEYLSSHASSNHLIASNKNIDHALRRLGKNDLVRIRGYLVDVKIPGEQLIRTSRARTDNWIPGQGNRGGSEFIYVKELQRDSRDYR